jgi:hypothetical protein
MQSASEMKAIVDVFFYVDTNFTDFVSGTCFLAFKGTLLGFALIRVDNGDSEL